MTETYKITEFISDFLPIVVSIILASALIIYFVGGYLGLI